MLQEEQTNAVIPPITLQEGVVTQKVLLPLKKLNISVFMLVKKVIMVLYSILIMSQAIMVEVRLTSDLLMQEPNGIILSH